MPNDITFAPSDIIITTNDVKIEKQELIIQVPPDYKAPISHTIDYCTEKHSGYVKITIGRPFRKRTSGHKSQNHHINGLIQQIIAHTGDDFNYYKYCAKERAIKRGYPFTTNYQGNPIPLSETKIDTKQAGYLIDQLYEDAGFLGITLKTS